MSFSKLGLSKALCDAVDDKGYTKPSPIQQKSIPAILKGENLMACAQTGTGKTAGFTLPILEIISSKQPPGCGAPRALIIAPTRELAAQINESIVEYGKNLSLRSTVIFGGVKMNRQINRLGRGVDILVATPGRLLDLYHQGVVNLKKVELFVLDEADRMLDMGFIHDIKKIINLLPKKRQNLLFSATFSKEIRKFGKVLLDNPVEITTSPENAAAPKIKHKLHPVDKKRKAQLLCHLIEHGKWFQVLVFSRTKHGANKIVKQLAQNEIQALAIHGGKSQLQRTTALDEFKKGKIQVLVATDIAARGIDIHQLPMVVNFDLPDVPEDYVHRIGRVGRAGASGKAISLVCADEIKQLLAIEKILKHPIQREFVEDFDPEHALPTRALSKIANDAKKQSQPKRQYKPKKQERAKKRRRAGV